MLFIFFLVRKIIINSKTLLVANKDFYCFLLKMYKNCCEEDRRFDEIYKMKLLQKLILIIPP